MDSMERINLMQSVISPGGPTDDTVQVTEDTGTGSEAPTATGATLLGGRRANKRRGGNRGNSSVVSTTMEGGIDQLRAEHHGDGEEEDVSTRGGIPFM